MPASGIQLETIQGGAIAGVPWSLRLRNAAKLSWSLGKANKIIRQFRPEIVFLTGGYVNVPVAVISASRRIPMVVYLPDIEPGLAIKNLSRVARRIACTAEESLAYFPAGKGIVTGYPVRPSLRETTKLDHSTALEQFDLDSTRKTLFVFGGSRGARSINRALIKALPELLEQIQVIHISGELDWGEVEHSTSQLSGGLRRYYRPFAYLHERMGIAFRAADLVMARAGASMLGECPAFGVPTILVPYPHAWRYQKVNADYLVKHGAALRLDDEKLNETLASTVLALLDNQTKLDEMSKAAHKLDVPAAAENIAAVLTGAITRVLP